MRNRKLKNLLALLLVLALLVSMFPVAFAEGEADPEPEAEAIAEEPAPEEAAEEPVEEPLEEDAPAALPYGFPGLPEGFGLTEQELAGKQAQAENDVLGQLSKAVPGVDYVDGQVMVSACSPEYARMIADAYNAELLAYSGHVALLGLRSASVYEAVEAGMNPAYPLPPVDPNYIVRPEPVALEDSIVTPNAGIQSTQVPVKQSWKTWMDSVGNPDLYLRNPAGDYQYMHDMVNTYEAWPVTTGRDWVTVAVVDSGVDYTHPELQGKVIKGRDFIDGDDDPMDENGHGTHCAGIIAAAQDNGIGGSGIAPDVQILAVRVLGADNYSTDFSVVQGIYYAADNGADIISMSLCGFYYNYAEQEAVNYAHQNWATLIAAMGNNGSNLKCYPAAYDHVIAVAAVNASGERAPYSNYGPWCDVAAPGSDIWSTLPGDSYDCWDGTSMATPVVAGVAALYMSWSYNVGPDAMEKVLKKAVNPCKSAGCGAGVVDASKLFAADKTEPIFAAYAASDYDEDGLPCDWEYLTDSLERKGSVELSPDDYVSFWLQNADSDKTIVLSDDGKAPSVLNGQIKHGQVFEGAYSLSSFAPGSTVTLKALCVSGMGVVSKVATWKIKIVPNHTQQVLDNIWVTINSLPYPDDQALKLVSGKSVTLSASVSSSCGGWYGDVDQRVTWSIEAQDGCPGARIDAKGKLSTKAADEGEVLVRAASVANPEKYAEVWVYVQPRLPVSKIELTETSLSLCAGYGTRLTVWLLQDKLGQPIYPGDMLFRWSSSNPKVAEVDEEGWVRAKSKGSATITCLALDGSGKKASCKVTVKQQVEEILLTGQPYAVSGTKVKFKATSLPANANDKGVIWSLGDNPGVTINQKGEVTIPKDVTGGSFIVVAESKNEFDYVDAVMEVTIVSAKASSVTLDNDDFDGPSLTKNKKGFTTAATLFSLDTPGNDTAENVIQLNAAVSNGTAPLWTSSKPSVAAVDENGLVTAVSAGTATITAAAQDGSGKKASCKITVINPVSYITVQSKNPSLFNSDDLYLIGIGKSASNKAVMGDAYGKPGNTKVTWSYEVYEETWDAYSLDVQASVRLTPEAVSGKWFTLSSGGKLTVNKSVRSIWDQVAADTLDAPGCICNLVVYVSATAQDGTGAVGTARYLVTPLTTKLNVDTKSVALQRSGSTAVFVKAEAGGYYESYTVTSSNPNVAGGYVAGGVAPFYNGVIVIFAGEKTGTATITIKANDGSGKSVSIKVKVS